MAAGEGVLCVLGVVFTLYFLHLTLQGCQGFGRRGQGSQHHDQNGTSEKYEHREERRYRGGKKGNSNLDDPHTIVLFIKISTESRQQSEHVMRLHWLISSLKMIMFRPQLRQINTTKSFVYFILFLENKK